MSKVIHLWSCLMTTVSHLLSAICHSQALKFVASCRLWPGLGEALVLQWLLQGHRVSGGRFSASDLKSMSL